MAKVLILISTLLIINGAFGQRRPGTRPTGPRVDLNPPVEVAKPSISASASNEKVVEIISQTQEVNPDGSFKFAFEAADGTLVSSSGVLKNEGTEQEALEVQGSAKWIDPNGVPVSISWKADENGVVYEGDHLPTPPPTQPIPEAIQRGLDWIAKHPSKDSGVQVEARLN